jgi:hypothetical protein
MNWSSCFKKGRSISGFSLSFYAQQLQPQVQAMPVQLSPQLQIVVCAAAVAHPHLFSVVSIVQILFVIKLMVQSYPAANVPMLQFVVKDLYNFGTPVANRQQ